MLNRCEAYFVGKDNKNLIIVCKCLELAEVKAYYQAQGYTYRYRKILNY